MHPTCGTGFADAIRTINPQECRHYLVHTCNRPLNIKML
jgi:hypothetical protein